MLRKNLLVATGLLISAGLLFAGAAANADVPGEIACPQTPEMQKVQALVKKTADAWKAKPEATLKEITAGDPKWKDGDLYIFVYEGEKGKVIAHGYNAAMVGKDLGGVKDPDGVQFNGAMRQLVMSKGEGCVKFKFPNPSKGGQVGEKIAFAKKLDDKTFLGSGYYL